MPYKDLSVHKEEKKAYDKRYYSLNREKRLAQQAIVNRTPQRRAYMKGYFERNKSKYHIRNSDRYFFKRVLSAGFLEGKEIHHDWENGETCYLLEIEKHKELHQ